MKNNFRNVRVSAKKYLRIFSGGFCGGLLAAVEEMMRDENNTISDAEENKGIWQRNETKNKYYVTITY